jgi:RNA polymerase sigma factor (sigma-70 family)
MSTVEFTRSYQPLETNLMNFALRLTRNRDEAKDLLQETALRAYKNRDKFRLGTNFKSWMNTIMRNTFINQYRKKKKSKVVDSSIDTFLFAIENKNAIANKGYQNIRVEEIREKLDAIGDIYSVPFLMFFRGYHYDEIAAHLDIPIGTVKSRIFFARRKLRSMIDRTTA